VVNEGVLDIGSTANLDAGVTVRTEGSGCVQLNGLAGQDLTRITGRAPWRSLTARVSRWTPTR